MIKIILNRQPVSDSEIKKIITSLSDPAVIQTKGGFLLKSYLDGTTLYLEILPYMINGERTYHYNMHLPESAEFGLSGFINSNKSITLLPIVSGDFAKEGFTEKQKKGFLNQIIQLCHYCIKWGFDDNFAVDFVTGQILTQLGVSGEIETTGELSVLLIE